MRRDAALVGFCSAAAVDLPSARWDRNRYGIMLPCQSSVMRNPVTPTRDETASLSSSS
jgi:hypothetical protein